MFLLARLLCDAGKESLLPAFACHVAVALIHA
jgi:hypothetical protein